MSVESAATRPESPKPWRGPGGRDFRIYWAGSAASQLGTSVSQFALPLLVLLQLHGTALDVGLIGALQFAPYLVLSLPAGLLADTRDCRTIMVACDLVSGLALAAMPVTFAAGVLTLPVVLLVVAVAGCATVVFEAADLNLAITLVEPETIGSAQAAVQGTLAVAGVIGPGVAGVLVAAFRASGAVVVDAASYLVSAVAMLLVHPGAREPVIRTGSLRIELLAGLRQLRHSQTLRPIITYGLAANLATTAGTTAALVFAVRDLHLSSGVLGLALAIGFAGAPVGAATSQRMAAALGVGPILIVGSILEGAGLLAASFAQHGIAAVPLFAGGFFVGTVGLLWFNVQSVTLRQRTTPPSILGRVNSSANLVFYAAIPLGSTLGGFLADSIGARQALLSASVVMLAVVLLLAVPRIRQLRVMPTEPEPVW